ncbi:MAG: DMT family transporter [Planctomycetota bacterium]|nr:MAG: DMT family transporter [Planctomycetota bacterium]
MAAAVRPSKQGAAVSLALGAATISFAPVLVRSSSLEPGAIGFWRMALAAAVLSLFGLFGERRRATPLAFGLAALAGGFFAGDLFLWHRAIHEVGVGRATLLVNTHAFWVAALAALLAGERFPRRFPLQALLALAGLALLCAEDVRGGTWLPGGVANALMAAGLYGASYLALREGRRIERPLSASGQLAVAALVSALGLAVLSCASEQAPLAMPRGVELLRVAALAGGIHVGGWLLITRAAPWVPAARGALLLLLQPALSFLWGAIWFGERVGPIGCAGAVVTLGAIGWASGAFDRICRNVPCEAAAGRAVAVVANSTPHLVAHARRRGWANARVWQRRRLLTARKRRFGGARRGS